MVLLAIGWLYVALMMALAEATHSNGSVLGAVVTFVLYGAAPVALAMYLMGTPARKKAIRAREAAARDERAAGSAQPDAGSETSADAVAPVGKEP